MPEQASMVALVHGRVQGVMFRAFVEERARSLGLTGYARNLLDGATVEVRAEGERGSLEKLLTHLRRGPPAAAVAKVDVAWSEYRGEFMDFRVRY